MNASFHEAWALLPDYLGQHVILSVSALLLGVAISLPLGDPRRPQFAPGHAAAGGREHRADHSGAGAAGAVLSAAAGAFGGDAGSVRLFHSRLGFSARAAGADALCDAADPAQSGDGAGGHRSRHPDGGQGRGHDAAPVPVQSRTAAGRASGPGGHPHRDRVGGRHHHACPRPSARPAWAITSSPDFRSRIGCSCCSAAWRRRRWRWCSICCWRWRAPAWRSVRARVWCWRRWGCWP